jgi:hypothetical protein
MVPVGFEEMPLQPEWAYKKDLSEDQTESWLIIADNSRKHQTFHSVRWSDICTDLTMENPNFFDIRNISKGIQSKLDQEKKSKSGKNSHCFIEFRAN